ncbi:MAG: folate-binding protein YgfZ [Methylobacter sp.]|nr:MAG: folate-binding protein YgfZ [Methylobacter sp.]
MAVVQSQALVKPSYTDTGMIELTAYQLIEVSGEDALSFLSNLTTSDVKLVSPTFSQFSAICDIKGRVLASFIIFKRAASYYLFLPATMVDTLVRKLRMHILRSKVVVSEVNSSLRILGLSGDNSAVLLSQSLSMPITADALGQVVPCGDYTVLLLPGQNQVRWLVVGDDTAISALKEQLDKQVNTMAWDDWWFLDTLSAVPFITPATAGEYLPQMLNLEPLGGLSFKKGCYPGQEIVARLHYRGKLKRKLYVAYTEVESLPEPGSPLYGEDSINSIGHVLASAQGANGQVALQAVIEIEQQSQTDISLVSPTGPKLLFMTES